jgi:hypothetical protein
MHLGNNSLDGLTRMNVGMYDAFIVQLDLVAASKLQRNIIQYCARETGKEKCSSRRQGEPKVQPLFALYILPPWTKLQDPSTAANQQAASRKSLSGPLLLYIRAPDQQTGDFCSHTDFIHPMILTSSDLCTYLTHVDATISIRHYIIAEVRDVQYILLQRS